MENTKITPYVQGELRKLTLDALKAKQKEFNEGKKPKQKVNKVIHEVFQARQQQKDKKYSATELLIIYSVGQQSNQGKNIKNMFEKLGKLFNRTADSIHNHYYCVNRLVNNHHPIFEACELVSHYGVSEVYRHLNNKIAIKLPSSYKSLLAPEDNPNDSHVATVKASNLPSFENEQPTEETLVDIKIPSSNLRIKITKELLVV